MSSTERTDTNTAFLRSRDGSILDLDGRKWVDDVDAVDNDVLKRAVAPVLDIGCGPGRHVQALADNGKVVLGIDLSSHAVSLARSKGLAVLERSVFEEIPMHGKWSSALLLDGNVGIGGEPLRLLQHVAALVKPGGSVLVEVEDNVECFEQQVVRLEIGEEAGPWFPWARVNTEKIRELAADLGMRVDEEWNQNGRHFVKLTTPLRLDT